MARKRSSDVWAFLDPRVPLSTADYGCVGEERYRCGVAGLRRRWYDADGPACPAPSTTASYTCTVVQQRTGRVGSDGGQRLSVASSSSRASLCGLRIA